MMKLSVLESVSQRLTERPLAAVAPESEQAFKLPGLGTNAWTLSLFAQLVLLRHCEQTLAIRILRALLIPLTCYLAVRVPYAYPIEPRAKFAALNFAITGIAPMVAVMRSLEYGLINERYEWVGFGEDSANGRVRRSGLLGTLACFCSFRGQGWTWGARDLPAPLPRKGLVSTLLARILWFQVNCAIASWVVKVAEASPDRSLNQVFDALSLPRAPGWAQFVLVGFGLGQAAWSGLELGFACTTLVVYALTVLLRSILPTSLRPDPFDVRMYPPLMRPPHYATSVRRFWSHHWHALFRRSFTVLAFYPATSVFGRRGLGLLIGTLAAFALSGLMHDFGVNVGVQGANVTATGWHLFESTLWFSSQALAIAGEQAFSALTARKVGGRIGLVWTISWIIVSGSFLARSWLNRGLADGLSDPWQWAWWRFVVPFAPMLG